MMMGVLADAAKAKSTAPDPRYDGMILGPGPAGRFDDAKVGVGVPRWDLAGQRWLLWYYARDHAYRTDAPPSLGSGRIGLATSLDFVTWQRLDGPGFGGSVLEPGPAGSFDHLHLGMDDVMRMGDDWYMWLFGGDETPLNVGAKVLHGYRMRAGLARSRDGINWTRLPGNATGGSLIEIEPSETLSAWPNGIHDGEKFVLFYTTTEYPPPARTFRSWLAYSKDGRTWEKQGELRFDGVAPDYDSAGAMTRHIVRNPFPGARWLMLYTAMNGSKDAFHRRSIAAATSDNLIDWQRLYRTPIFEIGPAANWDGGGVSAPQLTDHGGVLRMSYFGFGKSDQTPATPHGIGAAIARDRDLRSFVRVRAPS